MPTLYLPNLFFEEELSAGVAGRHDFYPSAAAKRLVAELAPVMGLLCDSKNEAFLIVDRDAVPGRVPLSLSHVRFVTHEQVASLLTTATGDGMMSTSTVDQSVTFRPWGWSLSAKQLSMAIDVATPHPDAGVVELVNSRRFQVPLDRLFESLATHDGDDIPDVFSTLCVSLGDVDAGLKELTNQTRQDAPAWVIKSNLSQAARNRIVGRGAALSDSNRRWLAKQFEAHQPVALEPWVNRISEYGLQFTIPADTRDDIRFDGAAEMLTDSGGRYFGSWICGGAEPPWITQAIRHGFEVARRARQSGYFGPMGLDCMRFIDPQTETERIRACHDVNARHTMGRVALSLRRFLRDGETGLWLHADTGRWRVVVDDEVFDRGESVQLNGCDDSNVRIVPTSPAMTGSKPTQLKTALLISSDRAALKSVADRILWHTSNSPPDC